jgi:hypothetical protein
MLQQLQKTQNDPQAGKPKAIIAKPQQHNTVTLRTIDTKTAYVFVNKFRKLEE